MRAKGLTDHPDPNNNGRPQWLNQIDASSHTFLGAHQASQKYVAVREGGGPPNPARTKRCNGDRDPQHRRGPIASWCYPPPPGGFIIGPELWLPAA
jgi:hypothetical protein